MLRSSGETNKRFSLVNKILMFSIEREDILVLKSLFFLLTMSYVLDKILWKKAEIVAVIAALRKKYPRFLVFSPQG